MDRIVTLRGFAHAPWPLLFAISAGGLIVSAWATTAAILPEICGEGAVRMLFAQGWQGFEAIFRFNPPFALGATWLVMLIAMMPPLLAMPLHHIWRSSLPRYRGHAVASFIFGYGLVWMLVGPVLLVAALVLRVAAGPGALLWAVAAALLWSASPWRQRALNQSHRLRRIGIFGWAKYRDSFCFGAIHAGWCVASCWAWMVIPLAAGSWHIAAMAVVGIIMLRERLDPPMRSAWKTPPLVDLAGFLAIPKRGPAHG